MAITPDQLRDALTRSGRHTPEEINELVTRQEQIEREREAARGKILGFGEPISRSERERSEIDAGGVRSHDTVMDDGWRSSVDNRLGELRGALDGLRHSFTILAGAVGLIATVMVFGFGFFGVQFNRLDGKIDALSNTLNAKIEAIPQRLSDEFRTMRAEMAAQTSAIANSITATRQAQPPSPPQIIVIPAPQPIPEPPKP
jgi:hypothetical protein